jgi:tetratricopeptide (TPR) repeat protein
VKKQQWIVIGSGVVLFCLVYFFGRTSTNSPKIAKAGTTAPKPVNGEIVDFKTVLAASKQELTPDQLAYINQLETAVVRGDVKEQQIRVYRQIADFWRDSAHLLLPYAYYSGLASKLENSGKSLTFAAHYFLDGLRKQSNPALRQWMATEAKELFEKALVVDPSNDSSKIGLGSCYLFGNISTNPMQGIQLIREVADRDPNNMYAQFMLGLGGFESGQFDKAIERLTKVVEKQPRNLEAILVLAESYERKGDKDNAVKWYEASKQFFTDKDILDEINHRIQDLKTGADHKH